MKLLKITFITAIVSLALFFFSDNKMDPDLWGHLTFGQDIFESGTVPHWDTYSYALSNAKWINHEWFSELVFYIIFLYSGSAGLIFLKVLLGGVITYLLYSMLKEQVKSLIMRFLFMLLSLSIISYGFATRPQMFTYLFFTVLVFLLSRFKMRGEVKHLYYIPALFLLWANMHGGFPAGLVLLFLFFIFEMPKTNRKALITAVTFISAGIVFINPNGRDLILFLLRTLSHSRPHLEEWGMVAFGAQYYDFAAAVIVAALAIIFSKTKRSGFEVAALLVFLAMAIMHNRHMVLFAILFSAYVPKYAASIMEKHFKDIEDKLSAPFLGSIFCAAAAFFLFAFLTFGKTQPLKVEVLPSKYPMNAAAFIKENGIKGNIFPFFDWAQMCIREFNPDSKVFFDGRYKTVYTEEIVEGYFKVLYGHIDHGEYLDHFPETDIAFLHPDNPLAMRLSGDSEWVRVYSAENAEIFLKDNEQNKKIIEAYRVKRLKYPKGKEIYYLERQAVYKPK